MSRRASGTNSETSGTSVGMKVGAMSWRVSGTLEGDGTLELVTSEIRTSLGISGAFAAIEVGNSVVLMTSQVSGLSPRFAEYLMQDVISSDETSEPERVSSCKKPLPAKSVSAAVIPDGSRCFARCFRFRN